MTEIILGLTILGLLIYHAWYVKQSDVKQNKLLKAIMAKNLQEYESSEIIEKNSTKPDDLPDDIEIEDLEEKGFQNYIKRVLKQNA